MKITDLWDVTPCSLLDVYPQYSYHFTVHVYKNHHSNMNNKLLNNWPQHVGSEVLTAVVMKSTILWDITPCSSLRVKRRFGGTYRLHLQGRKISRRRNQRESRWQVELCFYPEDGGDMFLRNVSWLSTDYTASYPRRWHSSWPQRVSILRSSVGFNHK
jgi:hypothetical protein